MSFTVRHASPKVRTNALISKCPTEMQREYKAQHPPREPSRGKALCSAGTGSPWLMCCGEQHKEENITLSHFLLERSTRGRGPEDPGKFTT